jgi:SAM-dependent methyltransferase
MPTVRLNIPVYLPSWLHSPLRKVKRAWLPPPPPDSRINIKGERQIEWTFISSNLPPGPGEALDFGCEFGYLSLLAAKKGFQVTAVDLQEQDFPWCDPNVRFVAGDLLQIRLPENYFDLIIDCSSVEHVGLAGRYGITRAAGEGDLEVMRRMYSLLKPGGTMLATMPCGKDLVVSPWHRVYGPERLPRLLEGFKIKQESFWVKDPKNRWVKADRRTALDFVPGVHPSEAHQCSYALGAFVLGKDGELK